MIFSFWTESSSSKAVTAENEIMQESIFHRKTDYPDFKMFYEEDVIPLIAKFDSRYIDLFRKIRIPACKSDIARLILLQEHGGLYVDAHIGLKDTSAIIKILDLLTRYELVLFDPESHHTNDQRFWVVNGIIGARKRSELLKPLIARVFGNLLGHFYEESKTNNHVYYDLWKLTGTYNLWDMFFFDDEKGEISLKAEYCDQIYVYTISKTACDRAPFQFYLYNYRLASQHWSERQVTERLFV